MCESFNLIVVPKEAERWDPWINGKPIYLERESGLGVLCNSAPSEQTQLMETQHMPPAIGQQSEAPAKTQENHI